MIWLLTLICLALPTYLIRFSVFGIPTTVLEILIYTAVLAQIVIILKSYFLNHRSIKIPSNIWLPIVLLLLAGIISAVISPDKRTSLGILKGWIFDPILLFWLVLQNVKTEAGFRKIIYGLLGGATIVSIWGILQAFGFSYLLPHQKTVSDFVGYLAHHRSFGPFESPNYLGMYVAPIASLALGYWLNLKLKTKNEKLNHNSYLIFHNSYFLTFCLAASLLALFFTKSFGAWLGFLVAALFLIWFYLPKEKRSVFLAFLILGVIILSALLLKFEPQRIADSFAARVEVWQVSWYLIKNHPILGIGLGVFKEIYNQIIAYIHFPPMNWLQMHPHNIFLAFWLNTGILGLFSFVWILYLFFQNSLKFLNHKSKFVILIAPMLAIIAHGLIDSTFWKNDLAAMFFVLIGLAFAKMTNDCAKTREDGE